MKKMLKQEKGLSLISLAAAIVVIGIVVTMLLYSVKDTKDVTNLTNMYSDIDNLTDKISNYYSVYGKIPAKEITGLDQLISSAWNNNHDDPRGANDTGKFLYVDLSAIDNISLNYGKSFSSVDAKLEKNESLSAENDSQLTDLYIINENSHNVFYLKGINVEGTMYYTNKDKDTQKVGLKYVDGVKIPDGFTYKSGKKKESGNPITVTDGTNEYFWANIEDGIYKLNEDATAVTNKSGNATTLIYSSSQDKDEFLISVDEFGGFYLDENGNIMYILVVDKWSQTYDIDTVYKDKNGDTAYIPAGFQISELHTMNTINKGLVIRNATTHDEYVWIDVPDNVLKDAVALDEIERALKEYSSSYHEDGYEDSWYQGCGITDKTTYNNLKNQMYMSIKENGGFYIGRYEAGKGTNDEAVSQRDKYPYNFVTVSQAQGLSAAVNSGNCQTSLMFGIQWDLVCKFIEETGAKSYQEIAVNSTDWGNYKNSEFEVTSENASYTSSYIAISKGTVKHSNNYTIYSTGASTQNMVLNIYDFAGNTWEWILEHTLNQNTSTCTGRGGDFSRVSGTNGSASYRYYNTDSFTNVGISFRVTLFKPAATTESN